MSLKVPQDFKKNVRENSLKMALLAAFVVAVAVVALADHYSFGTSAQNEKLST